MFALSGCDETWAASQLPQYCRAEKPTGRRIWRRSSETDVQKWRRSSGTDVQKRHPSARLMWSNSSLPSNSVLERFGGALSAEAAFGEPRV